MGKVAELVSLCGKYVDCEQWLDNTVPNYHIQWAARVERGGLWWANTCPVDVQ